MPVETIKTVLQVDGDTGMSNLLKHIRSGNIMVLYEGTVASILANFISYYPWFYIYNLLDVWLAKPHATLESILRSAIIGFTASAVSDTISNFIRVIKTVKQSLSAESSSSHDVSYTFTCSRIINEGGCVALFGRGLFMKIIANGLQSILFTVIWDILSESSKK